MELIHLLITFVMCQCVARGCVMPLQMPADMVEAGFSRSKWEYLQKQQQLQISAGRACTTQGKNCNFILTKRIIVTGRCETSSMPVCNHTSSDGTNLIVPFHPACSGITPSAFVQQIVEFSPPKASEVLRDLGYMGHPKVALMAVPCNITQRVEEVHTGHCFQHPGGHGCRNSEYSVHYHKPCDPEQ